MFRFFLLGSIKLENEENTVVAICFDFRKAFDIASHENLIISNCLR